MFVGIVLFTHENLLSQFSTNLAQLFSAILFSGEKLLNKLVELTLENLSPTNYHREIHGNLNFHKFHGERFSQFLQSLKIMNAGPHAFLRMKTINQMKYSG